MIRSNSCRSHWGILDESLPPEVTLFDLAAGTPLVWEDQWGRVDGD